MKTFCSLVAALTLVGPPAIAGPAPASAPPVPPANGGTTVEGVTVTGKPAFGKRCRETDKACLTVVAQEIWDKYPKEIALYCEKERMRRLSDRMNKEAMFGNGDTPGVDTNINSRLPTALEVVCSYKPAPAPADKPTN